MDLTGIGLLTASVVGVFTLQSLKQANESPPKPVNSAFIFVKPAANTTKVQKVVSAALTKKGCKIVAEGSFSAEQIDKGMLIDQVDKIIRYYPCSSLS